MAKEFLPELRPALLVTGEIAEAVVLSAKQPVFLGMFKCFWLLKINCF